MSRHVWASPEFHHLKKHAQHQKPGPLAFRNASAAGIAAAQLEIFSVDLGHIAAPLEDPQLLLSPQLRGRLRRPSPVEAEIRRWARKGK